jgi:pimeloyl-ACP methyl ester carboxylesterase
MRLANSRLVLFAVLGTTKFLGRFSERLTGPAAYLLWFMPWRVPVSERGLKKQAGWLEGTEPFTLRTSVGRIAGFTAGEGPLVVLVHGWGESSGGLGGFIAPLVGAGFKVLGFDLPAHGKSSGQLTHGPIDARVAVREVADHFGGAHAVIAHSLGATAALLAMRDGLDPKRVVLLAPNVNVFYAMDTFQGMFGLPPKAMTGLQRKIERRFGPNVWRDVNADELGGRFEMPALVFHDPADPQVPLKGSEDLIRGWRGAKLIEAPGLGHGTITRDDSVIEAVRAFLTNPSQEPAVNVTDPLEAARASHGQKIDA